MDKQQAKNIIQETFEKPFDKERLTRFIKDLLNHIEDAPFTYQGQFIHEAYRQYIRTFERIGKFNDGENKIDILVIKLQKETSIERGRTMQRNFVAGYLQGKYGSSGEKEAALVAFVSPDEEDWRFSLVKMDYKFEQTKTGKTRVKEEFTPARRWSFLVGKNENSHTAQSRLVNILANDEHDPTLAELELAFDIETVTKEFFIKYRELFIHTKEELDKIVKKDAKIKADFESKGVNTVDFAKKLLGQITFLYFLQKKGWFGVGRDAEWGTGSKHFLRELFNKKHGDYKNFFNDILEPLFYDALRNDRSHDDHYYSRFNCKIPFLNGGLFDPIGNNGGYGWVHTDILLPDELFSNNVKTKDDIGTGILDIFDRYNFTVKEDEPLEKEVAIDPELLGKAYEKFNAIRPDNFEEYKKALKSGNKGEESKFNKQYGVYYTPREIVHYMCQQSLINYLYTALNEPPISYEKIGDDQTAIFKDMGKKPQMDLTIEHRPQPIISKEDIETMIHIGEQVSENEEIALIKEQKILKGKQKSSDYKLILPEGIRKNAVLIDQKLADITVCDPAVGSGAFPVGMMSEIVKARNVLSTFLSSSQQGSENNESPLPLRERDRVRGEDRTVYDFKRHCIEKSLYGVDIDSGAVEIAKLRLWLSLVVDEDDIKNIKPLPNLDYKIICGNSLLGVEKNLFNEALFKELETLKPLYFNETNPTQKQEYKKQIDGLISQITDGHKEFDFEVHFSEIFHEKKGFDVVIANPPYVSNKAIEENIQEVYEKIYGLSDDLYNYFFLKSFQITKEKGVFSFISSDTYLTLDSKINLRNLFQRNTVIELIKTDNVFEDPMVEPAIIIVRKVNTETSDYSFVFKNAKDNFLVPIAYSASIKIFREAANKVFFPPTPFNLQIFRKYNSVVNDLLAKWWNKISTSRNIRKYAAELNEYRKQLKQGEITLLGLITEGGQGLATANNGKFIGAIKGSKTADNIFKSRSIKLLEAVTKYKIKELPSIKSKEDANSYLKGKSEQEIRVLFDNLKEKYGRDIFGQGYIYRIVEEKEIADIETLTDKEKIDGIANSNPHFVLYDKGDKYGNRWYLETPFYIDWSKDNVEFLKSNSGKKGEGMPVVRNPQFYFREGFCWSDINTVYLKCRLKKNGIHDVKSMSLFSLMEYLPDWYFVCIINSKFISEYVEDFLNNTQTFQINDARQLPIIIPTKSQMDAFGNIFKRAYQTKKEQFAGQITDNYAVTKLELIQSELDKMVYALYGLTPEEIEIVEGKVD